MSLVRPATDQARSHWYANLTGKTTSWTCWKKWKIWQDRRGGMGCASVHTIWTYERRNILGKVFGLDYLEIVSSVFSNHSWRRHYRWGGMCRLCRMGSLP